MTVTQQASKTVYAGDGVKTEFFVPFVFYDAEDLVVIKVENDGSELIQKLQVDYTVYGGAQNGAVTMTIAPTSQERVVIIRDIAFEQPIDYRSNDPFPAETHERGLDRLTLLCQQLDERLSRTFALSQGSGSDPTLPAVTAGAFIGWNAAGDGLENKTITLPEEALIAGSGVTITNNALSVDLAPAAGLEFATGELAVKVDGTTIRHGASGALELVAVQSPWRTGDIKVTTQVAPESGWLFLNGDTLGNAASQAVHAGDHFQALYVHLWSVMADQWAQVESGRGGTALQDWIDGKKLTLPDASGRALIGQGSGMSLTSRVMGERGGEEAHTLTASEMPRHRHVMVGKRAGSSDQGSRPAFGAYTVGSDRNANTEYTGSSGAHNNMPPFLAFNVMIKI